jgi:hypothetical protein
LALPESLCGISFGISGALHDVSAALIVICVVLELNFNNKWTEDICKEQDWALESLLRQIQDMVLTASVVYTTMLHKG